MSEAAPKILLVDDVRLFLELERTFLRRLACDTLTASSGEEAIEVLRSDAPDLVVLDDQMPGIGGLATCRRIKGNPAFRGTIVLMVSSPGLEPACLDAGADAFLPKPIVQKDFVEKIRHLLPFLKTRSNDRAFVRIDVEARLGGRNFLAPSRDLSSTGMFIKTETPAEVGERIGLRFRLPGDPADAKPILATAEVRNRVLPGAETRLSPGFGVLFLELTEQDRVRIDEFVRRMEAGGELEG
jgi:CheY-like chemotaxis protein